jgi:predicted KAP-like P-loop ATPase
LRLFPSELNLSPTDGFTPENDIFGRKAFGDQLTRIVRAIDSPSVLLLDAPWGTGKTTFVKMWRGELSKAGIASIYFDAFINDYQEDAFIAVASQIIAEAERHAPARAKTLKAFKKKALEAAKALGRASLHLGVRAATAGLIESESLEKAAADIVNAVGDEAKATIDDLLKKRLESHESDLAIFEQFRDAIARLADEMSNATGADGHASASSDSSEPALPLVVIIDELDRCRPSFSLELLERIKHFFSAPNVLFLLVCSLGQLEEAVCFN